MASYVIYNSSDGTITNSLTINGSADDIASALASNTPTGSSSLAVADDDPSLTNHASWEVISGVLTAVVPTDAALLLAAQRSQENTLNAASLAAQSSPVSYMSTTFLCNDQQLGLVQYCLTQASTPAGLPSGFTFCDNELNQVAMTLAELQGLYNAMFSPLYAAYIKLCTLVVEVYAATTVAAVEAIVWT